MLPSNISVQQNKPDPPGDRLSSMRGLLLSYIHRVFGYYCSFDPFKIHRRERQSAAWLQDFGTSSQSCVDVKILAPSHRVVWMSIPLSKRPALAWLQACSCM